MANLLGQDIGLNYKGIITIGSTINQNVSASLQSLTDGDGNALPLQLSTSQLLMGTAYTAGYYLNVQAVFSNYASSQDETANIALFGSSQATLNSATRFGFGVYGHGYTNGSARAGGVVGEGKVTATGDTGAAVGVRGYALDTHAGGINIGLYGNAASGATNYALWMEAGNINSSTNQSWLFNANVGLSIVGATAVTPTARLHVRGDGTNPIIRFENSAGVPQLSSDATGAFAFAKVVNMDAAGLTVGASRMAVVPFASNQARMRIGDTGASSLMGGYGNNAAIIQFYAPTQGSMGGAVSMLVEFTHAYTSSATGEYTHIQVNNTINHTSTGIDRLLYLKPVITASPDFRAIDVLTGSTSAHKLIRLANAASNVVFEVNAAQQIGLFGVTPIAQPTTAIASAAITPGGGGSILEDDLFAGYTVAQVVQALVNLGILKP